MWQDLFDIYQSVQNGETDARSSQPPSRTTQQRTMYIFAYLDDGTGKTARSLPVEERMLLLELRQQELERRIAELEIALQEALEEDEE